jgi:hypothetical protein
MARGNQREKAREKNLKEQAGKVSLFFLFFAAPFAQEFYTVCEY